jgi:hypothetical protein
MALRTLPPYEEYQDAVEYIDSAIKRFGGRYSDWYVGIAAEVEVRLTQHNAQYESRVWYETSSEDIARAVEAHFLDLGTKGGKSGGDARTRTVYAYRISPTTKQ